MTVALWRLRLARSGLEGLADEPCPGAPRKTGGEKITEVVAATLQTMPAATTHWSTRSVARASGLSIPTVRPHPARLLAAAAPKGDLQAFDGPVVRGEGPRHRRPVS
ncbi:MAG: helix-turn-helix domain-containing protein [Janthinobacterium lividum]